MNKILRKEVSGFDTFTDFVSAWTTMRKRGQKNLRNQRRYFCDYRFYYF